MQIRSKEVLEAMLGHSQYPYIDWVGGEARKWFNQTGRSFFFSRLAEVDTDPDLDYRDRYIIHKLHRAHDCTSIWVDGKEIRVSECAYGTDTVCFGWWDKRPPISAAEAWFFVFFVAKNEVRVVNIYTGTRNYANKDFVYNPSTPTGGIH